jgi:hypothetical protein
MYSENYVYEYWLKSQFTFNGDYPLASSAFTHFLPFLYPFYTMIILLPSSVKTLYC